MRKTPKQDKLKKANENPSLIQKRAFSLNMPQMLFGGLSENWFLKELGDMHWSMITRGLNAPSDKLLDISGNRLYASFVRIRWQSNSALSAFKENEEFSLQSQLSRFGEKLFFSRATTNCSKKAINASLMTVFAARKTDNVSLSKASPLHVEKSKIKVHDQIPQFGREYLQIKTKLTSPATIQDEIRLTLNQKEFNLANTSLFTSNYIIDPYEDLNGVNLLYFASYPKISDKCELAYFHKLRDELGLEGNWAIASSPVARDIFYYGNANPDEELIYKLNSCEFIGNYQLKLSSSLYRKKNRELIARIFTIKALTETEIEEHRLKENFTRLWEQKEAGKPDHGYIIKHEVSEEPDLETLNAGLIELLKPMLGINDINPATNLKPFGLESIVFTELSEQLNKIYAIKSNPSRFYGFSTVGDIAHYLLNTFKEVSEDISAGNIATAISSGRDEENEQKQSGHKKDPTPEVLEYNIGESIEELKGPSSAIAIVGMSGRFPQADDLDEFWNNLVTGKDGISEIPEDRWRWETYYENPLKNKNKTNSKWGGFLKDIRSFDAGFFNITPREAELMDPQQRLLLEETWHLLEHAGHDPSMLSGTQTGVFIGVCHDDYNSLLIREQVDAEIYDTTGASFSVLPNRISYFLDLHGPSVAIDTACSSALVAVHQAVQSIQQGECNMAIAGGVNICCTPRRYLSYGHAGMLSEDGRCKTFDKSADGYVRGEGVGMILLKPLARAEADGDRVYAVIRGSAMNHGGYTSSLTVPNPNAQADLLVKAYKKAAADPSTVSYIEAHGTGTSLGDPIEINGLKEAFKQLNKKKTSLVKPHCRIGSVKTNIGHLESAAGIAGLIKVVLSMQHKKLPGNLHFKEQNPFIELGGSPFTIIRETEEWKNLQDKKGNRIPLRAGVSSFGSGGTNVHVVMEEYIDESRIQNSEFKAPGSPIIIPLSAKNEESLAAMAKNLLNYLNNKSNQKIKPASEKDTLQNIAYTLQTGRAAMEEKIAFLAADIETLIKGLETYSFGKEPLEGFYKSSTADKNTTNILLEDEDGVDYLRTIIRKKNIKKLAQLWVLGVNIEWDLLYETKPQRVVLPGYPFVKEDHWIKTKNDSHKKLNNPIDHPDAIHPMIDTYKLVEHGFNFKKRFKGNQFYLSDHTIGEHKILPAVAYVEMLRASAALSGVTSKIIHLNNVVWMRPVQVSNSPWEVTTTITTVNPVHTFEIAGRDQKDGKVIHCQGKLQYSDANESIPGSEKLNYDEIIARVPVLKKKDDCYETLYTLGLDLGPGYRTMNEIRVNDDHTEAFFTAVLPPHLSGGSKSFYLHPSLMDSALHMASYLTTYPDYSNASLHVPFAIKAITIYGRLPEKCDVYIKKVSGRQHNREIQKFNAKITDKRGKVLVNMHQISFRSFSPSPQRRNRIAYYAPVWAATSVSAVSKAPDRHNTMLFFDRDGLSEDLLKNDFFTSMVYVKAGKSFRAIEENKYSINFEEGPDYEALLKNLPEKALRYHTIVVMASAKGDLNAFAKDFYTNLNLSRVLMAQKPKEKINIFYVYPVEVAPSFFGAMSGFGKTLNLESSKLFYRTIAIEQPQELLKKIAVELQTKEAATEIRYAAGKRWIKNWRQLPENSFKPDELPVRQGGVYLITGGLGGLGLIFARYFAENYQAKLILTGRSSLNEEKQSVIEKLKASGAEVIYIQNDIKNREGVQKLIKNVKEKFTCINGIIHSAGVIRDNIILKKTREETEEVLAAKLQGTIYLDEFTKEESLDLFVLFSSVSAVKGNVGQCDYAFANSFMDHFAAHRHHLAESGKRSGKTLSVNWPLWKEGGMQPDEEAGIYLQQTMGSALLSTQKGLKAFENAIASTIPQLMVIETMPDEEKTTGQTGNQKLINNSLSNNKNDEQKYGETLREKLQNMVLGHVSAASKQDRSKISVIANMSDYGLDSVIFTELANTMNRQYDLDLTPAVFFEYSSVSELSDHLLEDYKDGFLKYFKSDDEQSSKDYISEEAMAHQNENMQAVPSISSEIRIKERNQNEEKPFSDPVENNRDIAVIGMAGRLAQSANLRAFWQHLESGNDLITEIPHDHWDYKPWFSPDRDAANKTYCKWGSFMDDIDKFDPVFFGITPRQAPWIDPQLRHLLEVSYETFEDAGYAGKIKGSDTGVYVGVCFQEYWDEIVRAQLPIRDYEQNSSMMSSLSCYVSYIFDLQGASIPLDNACASSLTALHLACQALRNNECETALVAGLNALVSPLHYVYFSRMQALSPTGRCYTFDKKADGYVPGEGVVSVLLKPMEQAVRDGDRIHAVIKGTAINHVGKSNNPTSPRPELQTKLLQKAWKDAKIDPETISYIETHGTGTPLGDPIEVNAIKKAFKKYTDKQDFCTIGSAKAHVGHLEGAAGLTGVIKTILSMQHGKLPAMPNFEELNPYIKLDHSPLQINKSIKEWKSVPGIPLRAGVSSFGMTGNNAHVVLEEYVDEYQIPNTRYQIPNTPVIIPLSAKHEGRLTVMAENLLKCLNEKPDYSLESIAHTLQLREPMEVRWACVVSDMTSLKEILKNYSEGKHDAGEFYQESVETDAPKPGVPENEAVNKPISKEETGKLAAMWVSGMEINWGIFYEEKPQLVSLPTYPFEKRSYWFEIPKAPSLEKEVSAVSLHHPDIQTDHIPKKIVLRNVSEYQPDNLTHKTADNEQKETAGPIIKSSAAVPKIETEKPKKTQASKDHEIAAIERKVKEELLDVLYLEEDQLDEKKSFLDMGLDSILSVELIKKLNAIFSVNINAVKLYDHPTISGLSAHIASVMPSQDSHKNEVVQNRLTEKDEEIKEEIHAVTLPDLQEQKQPVRIDPVRTSSTGTETISNLICKGALVDRIMDINELKWQSVAIPAPSDSEVQISVKASALNFPDIMCVQGLYPTIPDYPFIPGFEVAGVVSATGNTVNHLKTGDEVIALTGKHLGGHAEYVNTPADFVVKKSGSLSFEEASSLPIIFITAYHSLYEIAQLKAGERVLIQTAAGGVGLMAVQLAKLRGAVVYGTSSSAKKRTYLENNNVDHVIDYTDQDFVRNIKEITQGDGVDVVLNTLPGAMIQKGLDVLAPGGRYVEIAVAGLKSVSSLSFSKMVSNQSFHSVDLRKLLLADTAKAQKYLSVMIDMLNQEAVKPVVNKIFPEIALKKALHYIQDKKSIGKVVLSYENIDEDVKKPIVSDVENPVPSSSTEDDAMSIAIIGMSGRFPQSDNVSELWQNLRQGKDCITEVPPDRWDIDQHYDADPRQPNKTYSKWGGFLSDIDKFDPLFFNISPSEAELMDPQQRLFLQEAWRSLEDAGYTAGTLSGKKCGVFVGAGDGDYTDLIKQSGGEINSYVLSGKSPAILAARIAFLLNLRGSNMAIDTACSSSLVALHEACQSILHGENEMALAGGVYIAATPEMHIMTSKAGMLSREGKCKTFDDSADGFVPGEGVGAVVLKPLKKAIADHDHIYGVIKGIAVNQDGKTNGIMAPSAESQKALELEVYEKYKIDPATITYVEAHGTGTKLGDPIETQALIDAFGNHTHKKQYCAIGSVKTNIGHTMRAAGIAGLLKVMLCIKYKELAPSLNYSIENEHINFSDSPFYVITELEKWESPHDSPRRAAISSFGFSGTNAHLVVEEYPDGFSPDSYRDQYENFKMRNEPAVILLSAKNEARLEAQVENLKTHLEKNEEIGLYDIAYTLQTGREPMEERLAFVVKDKEALRKNLENYLAGETSHLLTGNTRKKRSDLLEDDVKQAITAKQPEKLAQFWIEGAFIDWNLIYTDGRPQKISLPTYPFARESYWVAENKAEKENDAFQLHPLLHRNESDFSAQKYTVTYSGRENFLTDHKVMGEKVLPGTAYLELARAAGEKSLHQEVTQLKDITWLSPFIIKDSPQQLHISLFQEGKATGFEVYSLKDNKEIIHSQGKLSTVKQQSVNDQPLEQIRQRCSNSKTKSACYNLFQSLGLHYGKNFQGITELYYNEEEALSKITLSKDERYVLNPGVLDSALQTCIGLSLMEDKQKLTLPFSIKEVNIYDDLPESFWCYVRKSPHNIKNTNVNSYDVKLLNEEGKLLISFRKFVTLPLGGFKTKQEENKKAMQPASYFYTTDWQITEAIPKTGPADQLIILADGSEALANKLQEYLKSDVIVLKVLSSNTYFNTILKEIRLKAKEKKPAHIMVVYRNSDYLDYGFISGLLKTAHLENPKISGKTVGVDSLSSKQLEALIKILETEQHTADGEVRYKNGVRGTKKLISISTTDAIKKISIKENGVYLITGGGGGLGKIFAEYISKTLNTTIILTGRNILNKEKEHEVAKINGAEYRVCDVTDKNQVLSLIKFIKANYQKLDGLIHAAGVIRDSFVIKKTEKEANSVLLPKILGAQHLDEVTKEEALDFVIYFSSIAGVTGNMGQAGYAAANAYLDNYAVHRNMLVKQGKRQGHTLSINWPLWKDGGMKLDGAHEKQLEKRWGIHPLPASEGIRAFEMLLNTSLLQGIVVYGDKNKLLQLLLGEKVDEREEKTISDENSKPDHVHITETVLELCSAVLKIDKKELETDTDFSEYGVDSIMMMKILNKLEEHFNIAIEPTAVINYPTIALLAAYLETEKNIVVKHPEISVSHKNNNINLLSSGQFKRRTRHRFSASNATHSTSGKVAVIGMSCRLPQSDNLEAYWANLASGKDLITDTPSSRWDASTYYSPIPAPDKTYTIKGGFIQHPDLFDATYFSINDADAIAMDPQQRIALELSRELLAHAGYQKEELKSTNTGAYIGAKDNNYLRNNYHLLPDSAFQHAIVNSISNMIAARISDFYDLKGPSQVIDTACSSSSVAIHEACEAIISGKINMAIAGGISIMTDPFTHIGFSQAQVLSKDGKSYVFDERANGFVMGEGGGLVLLKDLERAQKDGDQIFGVISGSAVNNDGHTMGLTVPDKEGQKAVITAALEKSGISPDTISYYEAHGTGTLLGDPIEVKAATEVYQSKTEAHKKQYCAIGSVKSNLGHTMTAAGVTGLIKILLQMQHSKIVPTLHCERPHPRFRFNESPFYPNTTLKDWEADKKIAAISSFGFGGTNCHMIIEAPEDQHENKKRNPLPAARISHKKYWLGHDMEIGQHEITRQHKNPEPAAFNSILEGKIASLLQSEIAEILNISVEELSVDEGFMDLGLDSTQLIRMTNEFADNIKIDLYPTALFEYDTISKLAGYLFEAHQKALSAYLNMPSSFEKTAQKPTQRVVSGATTFLKPLNFSKGLNFARDNIRNDIAIIGISARFPGSRDPDTFWDNLKNNRDLITEIPRDRWNWRDYYGNPQKDNTKTRVKRGGFIADIDKFDSLFFGISPREAALMDPQQRITLEAVYHALEDAGMAFSQLKGSNTGVFIGVSSSDYLMLLDKHMEHASQAQFATGSAHSMLVNRISYLLDLHGPSEPVDTACSSSLIAIHRAVESIQHGNCDMAISGGVNVLLNPALTLSFSRAGMLSPDGRCKTFDQDANGYVRGEGVGIVILKSLAKAEKDGDLIYGVIKGTAENHGGKASTLTSPNPNAQKEVVCKAFRRANIDPRDVSYIETHGTGTSLGDPVETEGLKLAFQQLYKVHNLAEAQKPYCGLGSVKTNIGHLEAAAGIAGVIKALLAMKHGMLPGNPQLKTPNEYLKLENTPFYLQKKTIKWKNKSKKPKIAGISSFGFGGANAHIVIEEYQSKYKAPYAGREPAIIPLSAKNREGLKAIVYNLKVFLEKNKEANLYDIAYTLQTGREAMEERLVFIVSDKHDIIEKLKTYISGADTIEDMYQGNVKANASKTNLLIQGEAGKLFVGKILEDKALDQLANLWVSGITIDWNLLYTIKPCRISLPAFPFARERHWALDAPKDIANNIVEHKTEARKKAENEENTLRYYYPVWQHKPLSEKGKDTTASVIVFYNNQDEIGIIKEALKKEKPSLKIVAVKSAATYKQLGKYHYEINYKKGADYELVLKSLHEKGIVLTSFMYLSPGFSFSEKEITTKNTGLLTAKGLLSFFELSKALLSLKIRQVKLCYVYPEGSNLPFLDEMVTGFAKSVALESPDYNCKVIALKEDVFTSASLAKILLSELEDTGTKNIHIRYTDGGRQVNTFETIKNNADFFTSAKVKLKTKGTYLITGGTGGIGFKIAAYFAQKVQANLVLSGRSDLNEEKQEQIRKLESSGAKVLYIKADVSNASAITKAVIKVNEVFGDIAGVIHAAGVVSPRYVAEKKRPEFESELRAKVLGTLHLDKATRKEPLDFFITFSSISSVMLSQGLSAYASANAFMDHYMRYRSSLEQESKRNGKSLSINWPSWKTGGMKQTDEITIFLKVTGGITPLEDTEALQVFEKCLNYTGSQLMPVRGDQEKIKVSLGIAAFKTASVRVEVDKKTTQFILNKIETELIKAIGDVLKLKDPGIIDEDANLGDYGFDSITFMDLTNRLNQHYGLVLNPALFYGINTIRKLSSYLLNTYSVAMNTHYNIISSAENTEDNIVPEAELSTNGISDTVSAPLQKDGNSIALLDELSEDELAILIMNEIK